MLILLLVIGYVIGIIGTQVVMRCDILQYDFDVEANFVYTILWPVTVPALLLGSIAYAVYTFIWKYMDILIDAIVQRICPNRRDDK